MSELAIEEEPADDPASQKGLSTPAELKKERTAATLARMIFIGAGSLAVILIGCATATVLAIGSENATSLLAFFGSLVSALGTLLGGIIGYYFGVDNQKSK